MQNSPEFHWTASGVSTPMASPMQAQSSPTAMGIIRYMVSDCIKSRRTERRGGSSKLGSKYRGVTHHARTNRYESHIWDEGKQLYLGGFYNELQAALAYDLAATRLRGDEAILNFDRNTCSAELSERFSVTPEQVIMCLRQQSKDMNKVDQSRDYTTDEWELHMSHVINPLKQHIGVYASEVEAAQAYDRAMIKCIGLEAAPLINFQLLDYLDMLTADQISEAMQKGLIPSVIPQTFSPTSPPTPIYTVESNPAQQNHGMDGSKDEKEQQESHQANSADTLSPMDSPDPRGHAVRRRTSNTPRSVLDSKDDDEDGDADHEVGVKRQQRDEGEEETSPHFQRKSRRLQRESPSEEEEDQSS